MVSAWRASIQLGHDTTFRSIVQLVPFHVPHAGSTVFDEVNRAKWMSELSSRFPASILSAVNAVGAPASAAAFA